MRCVVVIPARYESTPLPGKPLVDIAGKPMIQHVYEHALLAEGIDDVIVATDDIRVLDAVAGFGGKALMTRLSHQSGTDRLAEVVHVLDADLYVNLQGDEPLVRPADIELLVRSMTEDESVHVGTLYHEIAAEEALDPNNVKLVCAQNGDALYFSRAPIPFPRDGREKAVYSKHVGVYAYRKEVLAAYASLEQPLMERMEKLEQLRLLSAGLKIRAYQVSPTGPGVDTPACLERVRAIVRGDVCLPAENLEGRLAAIKLVVTDIDGVLTDGSIYYDATGEALKRFHVRDGLGIRMLEETGVRVAFLSGRDSASLRKRASDLGVSLCSFGVKDKAVAIRSLMEAAQVVADEVVCIGDDSIDLPAFQACGISFAVADAPDYVKRAATAVLDSKGGEGAFRELSDRILAAQGKQAVFETADGFAQVMMRVSQ